MKNFRTEPYLWIHVAGIAVAPLFLTVTWLALSIGDPLRFYWLELGLIGITGIVPILWMQWTRPFNIFSLLFVAIKPDKLTEEQRKILSLFKTRKNKIFNLMTALGLLILGWYLYQWSPLGSIVIITLPQWRILGLMIAAIAFLLSNLFVQIPASVFGVLITSPQQWLNTNPYPSDKITEGFTVLGLRVNHIFFIPSLPEAENLTEKTS